MLRKLKAPPPPLARNEMTSVTASEPRYICPRFSNNSGLTRFHH